MTERQKRRAEARKQAKKENRAAAKGLPPTLNPAPVAEPIPAMEPAPITGPTPITKPAPVSEAQLAANRANSQLSTGPTSKKGLEISSRNNFQHGLTQSEGDITFLDSESKEDYAQRRAGFQKEWRPATQTEQDLVDRLVNSQWLRRRAMKLQTQFLAPDGQILDPKQFALYNRYATQHDRAFNKALSDLMRLRSLQLREQNGFESNRRKDELHAYKIQAAKARELKTKLVIQEKELRIELAERKIAAQTRPANLKTEAAIS